MHGRNQEVRWALVAALTAALVPAALAQPGAPRQSQAQPASAPLESVTVTATKPSDAAIESFIETRTAPTRVTGKMARWKTGICPQTLGLGDIYAKYVTQRIRDIAAAVGAPVSADPACKPNIEVMFTTKPQGLLDNIRKNEPVYLGYHDNSAQADQLATVTHPIQAWYTTATEDMRGNPQVDVANSGGLTLTVAPAPIKTGVGDSVPTAGFVTMNMPYASARSVTGGRLNDGLSSDLFNVLIVAEPAKIMDHEMGTLADYAAMLALSQPSSLDSCQEMPSISNLLVPGCTSAANRITDGDLAYLRALYKMTPAGTLAVQRDEMRYQMKKTLVTDKDAAN
jgi:hypothetical protein